jgi:three-Cys-motif partner protein
MAKVIGTVWELEPHTAAKHAILRRYLQAWIPILSSAHSRVVYIDGFAGPGVYSRGEDGSPIIALKSALEHAPRIKGEIAFLFIELDPERKESLERSVAALDLPLNFRVAIHLGKCDETINGLLDGLDRSGDHLAPTFAFLDPFGFSHTPFTLVKRLMSHRRCEVLITFMYEEINRFLAQEQIPHHFDALFGCPSWAQARQLSAPGQRKTLLRDLYRQQLEGEAGITYVRSFEMFNRDNRTDYFLFFGTKSIEGLKKMKEAMWRVDDSGTFQFSDATDPTQRTMFEAGPDAGDLRRRLLDAFRGRDVSIDELEEFVITQTPYRETHIKKPVLIPMENAAPPELQVVQAPPSRRRGKYPSGTVIRFV